MGNQIIIPHSEAVGGPQALNIGCDAGEVSDGYHTFNELYQHRYLLFCGMARILWRMNISRQYYAWKSRTHWINGELQPVWDGWFVAGIELSGFVYNKEKEKMITYHLPLEYWDLFDGIEREQAPPHDGHTSQDVIERLKEWLKAGRD